MKFLEGKSQSERKKIITALVLGVVTVCALFYTFVLSGGTSAKKTPPNTNGNINGAASPTPRRGSTEQPPIELTMNDPLLSPIPDNPFPPISGGEASRNIFAFYEPPPYVPKPPTPIPDKPIPTPTPAPPPPIRLAYANPNTIYAQTGAFTLEVGGDRFTPDSKIFFNGVPVETQFSSPQRLTAQIPAQLIAADGQRQIIIRTNDPAIFSNSVDFDIQPPPVPDFNFVGLVARSRANNDTALLQNKKTKEYLNVRLNDPVPDRFRVFSISSREVIVTDTALKLRHSLPFVEEKDAGKAGVVPGGRAADNVRGGRNNRPSDPNVQVYQSIPGIPDNIPRYVPPQPLQQPPPNPSKKDEDEDDNDPNR